MSDPFLGEIRIFGFTFPPNGWAQCNGQLLPIQQYTALFSILGTTYGGNGTTNFGLPNLSGSAAMGAGDGPGLSPRVPGEVDGAVAVTVTNAELPAHTHIFNAALPNDPSEQTAMPSNAAWLSVAAPNFAYADTTNNIVMFASQALGVAGGGQPHNNVQPMLVLNFCIALTGIFPQHN
jgi:microcystin-dependent protein